MFSYHTTLSTGACGVSYLLRRENVLQSQPNVHTISQKCFFEFVEAHLDVKKGVLASSTLKSYRYELGKIRKFCNKLTLEQVDIAFLQYYLQHLSVLGNSRNSISKSVKIIKALLTAAFSQGLISGKKLEGFSVQYISPRREHLSMNELRKLESLYQKHSLTKHQQGTLRAFLFSCYSGLRFSDLRNLSWSNIRKGKLVLRIGKTGREICIPLTKRMESILGERPRNTRQKVFSLAVNNKENRRLKKVIETARIKKHITFHCGRHTFATLSLNLGIAITVVQMLLDHSSVSTTELYAKTHEQTLSKGMKRWDKVEIGYSTSLKSGLSRGRVPT
jgi:integrase/recombinase XerC